MYTADQLKEIEEFLSERQAEIEMQFQESDALEPVPAQDDAVPSAVPQAQPIPLEARRRLELERTQLMTAIKRIQDGKFGVCVLCKQNIPIERLERVPESPLCAPCFEKRNKSTGRR
jgi:RNA polymerase-binding transcription factor DksA